jgi:hypothetical protein
MLKGVGGRDADGLREAFFRGYGETGLDPEELRELERALHATQAAGELSYLYTTGDGPGYKSARVRLTHLLDTSHARLTKR